jgi:hypothetical protein
MLLNCFSFKWGKSRDSIKFISHSKYCNLSEHAEINCNARCVLVLFHTSSSVLSKSGLLIFNWNKYLQIKKQISRFAGEQYNFQHGNVELANELDSIDVEIRGDCNLVKFEQLVTDFCMVDKKRYDREFCVFDNRRCLRMENILHISLI